MPNICSVPNCAGNYRNGPKVSVFSFPLKNPELLGKWIRAIKRDFTPTPHSNHLKYDKNKKMTYHQCAVHRYYVSELHFSPDDIVQESSYFDERTGRTLTIPLSKKKLKEDAVPSKMPNCPAYMSTEVVVREKPEARAKRKENEQLTKALQDSKVAKAEYDAERSFSTFEELKSKLHLVCLPENWTVLIRPSQIAFCEVHFEPNPIIRISVIVDYQLKVNVYYFKTVLKKWGENYQFPFIVNNVNLLSDILSGLVRHKEGNSNDKLSSSLELAQTILNDIVNIDDDKASAISFLVHQVELLRMKKPSYNSDLLIFAALFRSISPHAYRFVRARGIIKLPHPSTLERVCSSSHLSPIEEQGDQFLRYIKYKFNAVQDGDKKVILLLDEVHVKPFVDFKGGNIVDMAFDSTKMASTAHVFMINSITSSYKDVVHILPVKTINHDELHRFIRKIILELENIGFMVVGVITDNNAINRSAMARFSSPPVNEIVYPHPANKSRPLFHVFDSVHLVKCIRNNWLNQKNCGLCTYFPDFNGFTENEEKNLHVASFNTLRDIHSHEENSLAKFGYNLTLKALSPTVFERQNVNLALKIFNDFVAEALIQIGAKYNLPNSAGTAAFIRIINTWWSIMNVKSPFKGARLNDRYKYPLANSEDDERKKFLLAFLDWLDTWTDMNCDTGKLTKETHMALKQTTHAIVEIVSYCPEELGLQYILPGKFQTDNLESRFSLYRQLSGGQYLVSIRQIFESEKKLRMQSCLQVSIKSKGVIVLSDLSGLNFENTKPSKEKPINVSLNGEDFVCIGDNLPVLVYIAGYAAYSVNKHLKCSHCRGILSLEKVLEVGKASEYTGRLDRGQLMYPTPPVVNTVMYVFVVISKLCFEYEQMFLKARNHRGVAVATIREVIINEKVFPDFDCPSGHSSENILTMIVRSSVNVFLNNYCKEKNNLKNVSNSARKLEVVKNS